MMLSRVVRLAAAVALASASFSLFGGSAADRGLSVLALTSSILLVVKVLRPHISFTPWRHDDMGERIQSSPELQEALRCDLDASGPIFILTALSAVLVFSWVKDGGTLAGVISLPFFSVLVVMSALVLRSVITVRHFPLPKPDVSVDWGV